MPSPKNTPIGTRDAILSISVCQQILLLWEHLLSNVTILYVCVCVSEFLLCLAFSLSIYIYIHIFFFFFSININSSSIYLWHYMYEHLSTVIYIGIKEKHFLPKGTFDPDVCFCFMWVYCKWKNISNITLYMDTAKIFNLCAVHM